MGSGGDISESQDCACAVQGKGEFGNNPFLLNLLIGKCLQRSCVCLPDIAFLALGKLLEILEVVPRFGEGPPRQDIMLQTPPSRAVILSRAADTCNLKISCYFRRSPGPSWRLATLLEGTGSCRDHQCESAPPVHPMRWQQQVPLQHDACGTWHSISRS